MNLDIDHKWIPAKTITLITLDFHIVHEVLVHSVVRLPHYQMQSVLKPKVFQVLNLDLLALDFHELRTMPFGSVELAQCRINAFFL